MVGALAPAQLPRKVTSARARGMATQGAIPPPIRSWSFMGGVYCDIISPERPPAGRRGGGMAVAGRRMSFGKRYSPPGSEPGTLRAPDTPGAGPVRVTVMDYGPERLIEKEVHSV